MVSIVQSRSTVYCYTSLYMGYTCSLSTFKSQPSWIKWKHFILWCFWSNPLVRISSTRNYYIHKNTYWLGYHCSLVFNKYWYIFHRFCRCCFSENVNTVEENAFVSCSNNSWCTATCYRGYIFPTGLGEESFSCQDGMWTPLLSSCKRTYKMKFCIT